MKNLKRLFMPLTAAVLLGACSAPQPPTAFNVASYNLRYANHSDSIQGNGWGYRYPIISQIIRFHDFDIFGTQECLHSQLKDLEQVLPGYAHIGVGCDDGIETGEHLAIFYRTDKFDLVKEGNFWLSETPDRPSVGWDAVLPRICTWGHFRYKPTGVEFLFFNLHMDHVGKKARVESSYLVQRKMKELSEGLPVILTGDFNVDQTHSSYKAFAKDSTLCDAYEVCQLRYALNGTFNSFDPRSFTSSRIDHIFLSPAFHVKKYGVLTDTYRSNSNYDASKLGGDYPSEIVVKAHEARTPSDHFPVKAEVVFEE